MKKLGKIVAWVLAVLAAVTVAAISFTIGWRPFIGPQSRTLTARKFDSTPARLMRGNYLVNHVTDCMVCHAKHDWTNREAPILSGTVGSGQDVNLLKGFPGKVYAPNITPDPETGAGNWTDDQLARAIREGVSHDGRAVPVHALPGFPRDVGRRLSVDHRLPADPAARSQAVAGDAVDFPSEVSDPKCATAARGPGTGTGCFDPREAREIPRHNLGLQGLPHAY